MAEEQLKQEQLSQMIFNTLSVIGFDRRNILHKSEAVKKMNKHCRRSIMISNYPMKSKCVGSTAEGVCLSDSDLDFMNIIADTVCVDTAYACKGFNVLEADYTNTAPGYVKLVLSHGATGCIIFRCLQRSGLYRSQLGSVYISSLIFRNFILQEMQAIIKNHINSSLSHAEVSSQGPAISSVISDNVYAMYYYGGCHLSKWSKRVRYCHWPSVSFIKEISSMEGYVVPIGHKSSDSQNIEWRVCYTTAELKLINSLTDVQLKFYILLKCVAKEIKKNVCNDITSYIVKNIVFWIVETEPEQAFTPNHLVKLLKKAILFIKYCLQNNHLPNYMIPERNLIRDNMNGKEKRKIMKDLKEYEDFAIDKFPKLSQCMSFVFQILKRPQIDIYKEWRNNVESCLLAINVRLAENVKVEMLLKGTFRSDINRLLFEDPNMMRLLDLTVPDWLALAILGRTEYLSQLFSSRLKAISSL